MRRRRSVASIAACLAFLSAQIVVPSFTRASDQDYDLLRMQLDGLVSQRAALMPGLLASRFRAWMRHLSTDQRGTMFIAYSSLLLLAAIAALAMLAGHGSALRPN